MTVRKAACPSCGAEIEFRNAATILVVCPFCGGASARKGLDLEKIGKVAEVAPIDSLLEIGTRGKVKGLGWTAVGQVQLDHGAGPWNEWCLLFDDGSWGWLAEAQGELLVTRPVRRAPVPPHDRLAAGDAVDLGDAGHFVVAEVGKARVTAVRGELPEGVRPGEIRLYADLRGKEGAFATLDYGDDRTCDAVFAGLSLTPEAAGLDPSKAPAGAGKRVEADRIQCPKCGGEVRLRDPGGAMRVACASCGSLLDPNDPDAEVLGKARRVDAMPTIPLGTRGRIRGLEVEVIAFLVRSVRVEGIRYDWNEYLLKAPRGKGYRWLVEANRHWSFVEPVSLGDLSITASKAEYRGTTFRHFQSGRAEVDAVYGEVYWEVKVGEAVVTADYVAPPQMISTEGTAKERVASLGTYIESAEVMEAFGLKKMPRRPIGVGPHQPNPHRDDVRKWMLLAGGFLLADVVLSAVLEVTQRQTWTFPCCFTVPVLLFPALAVWTRSTNFETKRWAESDHPRTDDEGGTTLGKVFMALFFLGVVAFAIVMEGC